MPEGDRQSELPLTERADLARPPLTAADIDVAVAAVRVGISDRGIEDLHRLHLLQNPNTAQQEQLGSSLGRISMDTYDRELES